ncbi:HAD family hydrolase [Nonomuraea deserti]|uniref:HAD family hydrolase n=1 Tax=Nonomuraea deserti TaxID=1848322 RepID=A0A4R4V7H1_9ACTN|nr:HAD-IA family hydrolase [Nonomuraea deserti]TDC99286.1 HAD family hydrolase [Nonomuraea deserti]
MPRPKVVLFDAMGVLYRYGNVQGRVLIPYLRDHGCSRTEQEIRAAYRSATLGGMTTDRFWSVAGLSREGRDADYCTRHQLNEGVAEALAELGGDGLELACLSNDTAVWSELVRRRFGLEGPVRRWFVSSDLRARKPDGAAYTAVIEALGVAPDQVVFVDDRPVNLVPARTLGMCTIVFLSDDTDANPGPSDELRQQSIVRTMPELVAAIRDLA